MVQDGTEITIDNPPGLVFLAYHQAGSKSLNNLGLGYQHVQAEFSEQVKRLQYHLALVYQKMR
jgi:hypothetical protein